MGDGQHIWASAEWVLMVRNCFVREEGKRLIVGSGIPAQWLSDTPVSFGVAPTLFGDVSVSFNVSHGTLKVTWEAHWRGQEPSMEIHLPGMAPVRPEPGQQAVSLPYQDQGVHTR